jgi:hypothetical protein
MIPRVVRQGEYLAQIAHSCGFVADDVWNDPQNAELKKLRKDPRMLRSGDVLRIPEPSKTWLPVTSGAVNTFVATVPKVQIILKLVGKKGPLKSVTCRLTGVPGIDSVATDADGTLKLSVPVHVRVITIDVDSPRFHAVAKVGHMDPPDTPSGVRMRLRNLHYLHDHQAPDPYMKLAVGKFQDASGLPRTGEIDDGTRNALVTAHGC